MTHAIGIDLGTTNSVAAALADGQPYVIPNRRGDNLTPSAVFLDEHGGCIVGLDAREMAEQWPEQTFLSIKRKMGTEYRRDVRGRSYCPEEISAMILTDLKQSAEAHLGRPIARAVVTVPANFNSVEREATKSAGTIAGLEVLRVLNEPTAAALAYGQQGTLSPTVVVFDLGGGTFDVSVVRAEGSMYEVVYSLGDNRLGGDDCNMLILAHLVQILKERHGLDAARDKDLLRRLRTAGIAAKHDLSDRDRTRIVVPDVGVARGQRITLDVELDRPTLAGLLTPVLARLKAHMHRVRTDLATPRYRKGLGGDPGPNLERCDVLLVGGESRVHAVQDALREVFGGRVLQNIDPDEVVALGAAVQAGILTQDAGVQGIVLVDSTSLSLGTEVKGGGFSVIVPVNTPIPVTRTQEYYTVVDNQTQVRIGVYQGESTIASQNKLLGDFILDDFPARPAGKSPILITYDVDANDILHVEARDKETGRRAHITIRGSQTLPADEVIRMRRAAAERESDNAKLLRRNHVIELSREVEQTSRRFMHRYKGVLHPLYVADLEQKLATLDRALGDPESDTLERSFYDLYHLAPRQTDSAPNLSLTAEAAAGFRVDEWGRIHVRVENRGQAAATDVQITIEGQIKSPTNGAFATILAGNSESVVLSICPTSAGTAVPLSISLEFRGDSGARFLVKHNVDVEVVRASQAGSSEAHTLINVGEVINHSGIGSVQSSRTSIRSLLGDYVVGGKSGDVVATRSRVNLGARETTPTPTAASSAPASPPPPAASGHACPGCKASCGSDDAFCSKCGTRLQARACDGCGRPVTPGSLFCSGCGSQLK